MAPNEPRKGFTMVPPGQHPNVAPTDHSLAEGADDGITVTISSTDPSLARELSSTKPAPIPTTTSANIRRFGEYPEKNKVVEPQPNPEPVASSEETFDEEEYQEPEAPDVDPILLEAGYSRSQIEQLALDAQKAIDDSNRIQQGIYRNTRAAKFTRDIARDSAVMIDEEMRSAIDEWIIADVSGLATVEAAINDFAFGVSENGAALSFPREELSSLLRGMISLRNRDKLITMLNLDHFREVLMLQEIEETFGRTRKLEEEQALLKQRSENGKFVSVLKSINAIVDTLDQIKRDLSKSAIKPSEAASPFLTKRPTPVPRATNAAQPEVPQPEVAETQSELKE